MRGRQAVHRDVAAGDAGGGQIGAGFDAVVVDGVLGAVQFFDALDGDGRGAGAVDLAAHLVEELGEVDDFGLARGVLNGGGARRPGTRPS